MQKVDIFLYPLININTCELGFSYVFSYIYFRFIFICKKKYAHAHVSRAISLPTSSHFACFADKRAYAKLALANLGPFLYVGVESPEQQERNWQHKLATTSTTTTTTTTNRLRLAASHEIR